MITKILSNPSHSMILYLALLTTHKGICNYILSTQQVTSTEQLEDVQVT